MCGIGEQICGCVLLFEARLCEFWVRGTESSVSCVERRAVVAGEQASKRASEQTESMVVEVVLVRKAGALACKDVFVLECSVECLPLRRKWLERSFFVALQQ